MMEKSTLIKPTFIGIGAHKSGTTWVSEILRTHPEVFMAHGKELSFFTLHYDKGEQWYSEKFTVGAGAKAVGEYSATYMDDPIVARRIHAYNPHVKLLFAVRNPVRRAYSHYKWLLQQGNKLPPFTEALETHPILVHRSLYYQCLSYYWKWFPPEQIHIIRFDDIQTRPDTVQRNIYRFLNIDENFLSPYTRKVIGKTIDPRLQWLEDFRRWAHRTCKARGIEFIITWVKTSGLSNLYRRINDRTLQQDDLNSGDYEEVYSYFQEDLQKFSQQTGIDISPWQPPE
jgi:hypothetical protein